MTYQTQEQQLQLINQRINQLHQKQQSFRNSTIVAMSSFLAANIESGLMRILGYHRDPQTRATFMEDELARVFVTIFDVKHLRHQLLLNMFAKEVEMADCYQMILRGNGLPTKMMSFCFKLYGSHYLLRAIQ
ncbi:unnamed protein product, partial [Rotaria magnacalcarata]